MSIKRPIYKSYILRIEHDSTRDHVHIQLHAVTKDAEVLHFTDMASLIAYLETGSLPQRLQTASKKSFDEESE